MQALICSGKDDNVMSVTSLADARQHLGDPSSLVWLDFSGVLSTKDQQLLKSMFDFHELAIEDAAKPANGAIHRQRPKIELYNDRYFFMVMQAISARKDEKSIELKPHEIDLFVGSNYLVTIHHEEIPELAKVWQDAQTRPGLLKCGPDRLTYFILDAIVDKYIDVVDDIEDVLDNLEDAVIDPGASHDAVRDIFAFKRQLINFRRVASPLRDVINEMTSRNFPHIHESTLPYLRDVYDHLIRLADMLDTYRDILTGALDVHLSAVSNSLNLVMKRLTVVATIFLPLTFITGFWGMNFTDYMPLQSALWWWGSLVVMILLTIGMIIYLAYSWMRKWM
jgi:magnesium transporter